MLIIYSLKASDDLYYKKENEKLPICGKFIYNAGFISLDRSDAHQAVKAIKKLPILLQTTGEIFIFVLKVLEVNLGSC